MLGGAKIGVRLAVCCDVLRAGSSQKLASRASPNLPLSQCTESSVHLRSTKEPTTRTAAINAGFIREPPQPGNLQPAFPPAKRHICFPLERLCIVTCNLYLPDTLAAISQVLEFPDIGASAIRNQDCKLGGTDWNRGRTPPAQRMDSSGPERAPSTPLGDVWRNQFI